MIFVCVQKVNGNVKNLIKSRSFLSTGKKRSLFEICQRVIKISARIFTSVADGIKRPRDTNVIFIFSQNQASRYFRLVHAPSNMFLDQKAFLSLGINETEFETTSKAGRRIRPFSSFLRMRYFPCFHFTRMRRGIAEKECEKNPERGKKRKKQIADKEDKGDELVARSMPSLLLICEIHPHFFLSLSSF